MQFFEKQHLVDLLIYLNNVRGIKMNAISRKTGLPLSTIKNIKTGQSGKKEYFDIIIKHYPEALRVLNESQTDSYLYNKKDIILLINYINKELGFTQGDISKKTGLSISTITNIKSGRTSKEEYFDLLLEHYPRALDAIDKEIDKNGVVDRKELFKNALTEVQQLQELKRRRELKESLPDLEKLPNLSPEDIDVIVMIYEYLEMEVPKKYRK